MAVVPGCTKRRGAPGKDADYRAVIGLRDPPNATTAGKVSQLVSANPAISLTANFFPSNDGFFGSFAQCEVGAGRQELLERVLGRTHLKSIQSVNTEICSICKGGIWQREAKYCAIRMPAPVC